MKRKKNKSSTWRRVVKIMVMIVGVALALVVGLIGYIVVTDKPEIGHWESEDKRKHYSEAYAQAMQQLPVPSERYDVPTDFGTVRVYKWANEETRHKTPVVLLPGRSSGVPM